MLAPKKVKWRKMQKGRRKGTAWRGATLAFGDYGLQAVERGWLTAREIEAARVALTRYIKRGGRVWVRIFPDKPLTKKPAETRMGKGKGSPEIWVAVGGRAGVGPGRARGAERVLGRGGRGAGGGGGRAGRGGGGRGGGQGGGGGVGGVVARSARRARALDGPPGELDERRPPQGPRG